MAGGGVIWARAELAREGYDGTRNGDSQVGRLSCAEAIWLVSTDRSRNGVSIRGKLDGEKGRKEGW